MIKRVKTNYTENTYNLRVSVIMDHFNGWHNYTIQLYTNYTAIHQKPINGIYKQHPYCFRETMGVNEND